MEVISFKKTVVGWYNFTIVGVIKYNVNPIIFRKITGVSKRAMLGTCEVTAEELWSLKSEATYLGISDGWKIVPNDEKEALTL